MPMDSPGPSRGKRHAQLRHQPRSTALWVGNPHDWELVRRTPRPPLVCPEPECDVELISYENLANRYNPRIFKFKAANACEHWPAEGGGGPESAQHEWLKLRLLKIVQRLGYTATPEHAPTRADVFVHEPAYCLEVQLRPTQFRKRTKAREAKDAKVCWLIREGLDTETARKALFGLPAVRFRVVDQRKPGRLVAPWDTPEDRSVMRHARLEVFAGAATLSTRPGRREDGVDAPEFRTHPMDGLEFLAEVLAGERRWYPPNVLGQRRGLWALKSDVARYYSARQAGRKRDSGTGPNV